ncbi:MAG: alpha/beta hydrolase [Candidatus Competibacteraceae bacterium]|nr:alpha/beta hydrolase [Candidatus Competibacteraceae bacterium]
MNEQSVGLATTRVVAWRQRTIRAADGLRLHVRDYGDPASRLLPVICLPGLARTSADFDELACHIAWRRQKERRVVALDYRGRGLSDYDPNWQNYDIRIELDDVLHVLTALGIGDVILVGTSRGGLISMAMAAARPAIIRGVVMNDIGPVIDGKGLARIKGYVGKLPAPASWAEAVTILKRIGDQQSDSPPRAQSSATRSVNSGRRKLLITCCRPPQGSSASPSRAWSTSPSAPPSSSARC